MKNIVSRLMASTLAACTLLTASAFAAEPMTLVAAANDTYYSEHANIDLSGLGIVVNENNGQLIAEAKTRDSEAGKAATQLTSFMSESDKLREVVETSLANGEEILGVSRTNVYFVEEPDENGEPSVRLVTNAEVNGRATGITGVSTDGKLSMYSYATRHDSKVSAKVVFDWDYNIITLVRNKTDAVGLTWDRKLTYDSYSTDLTYSNLIYGSATLPEFGATKGCTWYFKSAKQNELLLDGECDVELTATKTGARHYMVGEYILTKSDANWSFGLEASASETGYQVKVTANVSNADDKYERIVSPLYFVY